LQIVSTPDLVPATLDFALVHGLSVYDGTYAALAESLGVPLVTADAKLARRLGDVGGKAILLKTA
jgi:predicted nucleic acid-binding protein